MGIVNKSITKKRGRPPTGRDPVTAIRLPPALIALVDKWASKTNGRLTRSEAIRRLVELGAEGTEDEGMTNDSTEAVVRRARMNALDVQDRLEYARSAVAVLRALEIADRTMRYGEFAKATGLIPDTGHWQPWHRQQIAEILNLVAAAERQGSRSTDIKPLEFWRVITDKTGRPGKGLSKESRIVRK